MDDSHISVLDYLRERFDSLDKRIGEHISAFKDHVEDENTRFAKIERRVSWMLGIFSGVGFLIGTFAKALWSGK